jgi:hypothetical protein
VVDFIAGAGNKVIGAFGGGVGFVRGLVQPNTANPIAALEKTNQHVPAVTPGLEGARNDAPWNAPSTPLSSVMDAKAGDPSVFEKQQQSTPLPPPPTSAPVPSPLIQNGPGFGMLRRTSTSTGALLGGLGTLVSNAVTLGVSKNSREEGKMLVSLAPEKGEATTESETDDSKDGSSEEDGEETKGDGKSIKSFETMLSESQRKSKKRHRPNLSALGIKVFTSSLSFALVR